MSGRCWAAKRKVTRRRDDRIAGSPDAARETHRRPLSSAAELLSKDSMAADRRLLAAAFAAIAFLTVGPARAAVGRPTQTAPASCSSSPKSSPFARSARAMSAASYCAKVGRSASGIPSPAQRSKNRSPCQVSLSRASHRTSSTSSAVQ